MDKSVRLVTCVFLLAGLLTGRSADTLQAIHQRGTLTWGADAEGGAPYVFVDPQEPTRMTGFEFDLADALAARLGVKAQMVQNSWDGLVPALQRGNFDIILNGLEITDEHRQQIALSRPYYAYAQQIVVRKGTTGLTNLADLKGKPVGILAASVAQRLLEKMGGVDMRVYPGNVESFRDLNNRRIDAVLLDLPIAIYYLSKEPGLAASGEPFEIGYYGIGVRKGDAPLLEALNQAIEALRVDGTLERIYTKYHLWDSRQARLATYRDEALAAQTPISTLRDWRKYLPLLLKGALVTVEISSLAMILAVGAGLLLALARLYGVAPLRWLSASYIEAIRGTPLLIQLFMIYYGLPNVGIRLGAFTAAVLGLGLNYAAYEAENYRAGLQAVPGGQMEAALALGMNRAQAIRRIIIPQALRIIIPPVTNDFIALFKDSSLVSVITMVELTKVYGMLATTTYDYIGLGLMTAAIYFGLSYPASILADRLEKKLHYGLHHRR
jgi:polar amino acid transport system substrate-binding protein